MAKKSRKPRVLDTGQTREAADGAYSYHVESTRRALGVVNSDKPRLNAKNVH